ncbi:MAG: hypothetical protein J6V53_05300 [Alphaproteobacteria bacterium]|nr:hypothetical protein [Alphaproteobacteria bacterium]
MSINISFKNKRIVPARRKEGEQVVWLLMKRRSKRQSVAVFGKTIFHLVA